MTYESVKKALILTATVAALSTGLSACGRMADLEAPGATPRQTERATRDRHSERLPEPATINRPSSQLPIDGGPSNPFGGRKD